MDKQIKKKYREEFENKKLVMGILAIRNRQNGKIFLKATLNAEGSLKPSLC